METYVSSQQIDSMHAEMDPKALVHADHYAKHQIVQMLVDKFVPGEIYTVKLRREERLVLPPFPSGYQLGMSRIEIKWLADIGIAQAMELRVYKSVEYATFRTWPLVTTAAQEIGRRIGNRRQRISRRLRDSWRQIATAGSRFVQRVEAERGEYL